MDNGQDQKFLESLNNQYTLMGLRFHFISDEKKNDKTEQIASFFNNDYQRLRSAIDTMDRVISFCNRSDAYKTFYQGYWDRLDISNKSTAQIQDNVEHLLINFEKRLKPVMYLGGDHETLEALSGKTLGSYLNRLGLLSGNNSKHYLFETILKYRNSVHADYSEEDLKSGQYQIPHNADTPTLMNLINLCSCGLLIIVDRYSKKINSFLDEHKDEWDTPETDAVKFDFDAFIDSYVSGLKEYGEARMQEKVGHYGGLSNDTNHLMTLFLKKEVSNIGDWEEDEKDDESSESKEVDIPMEEMRNADERICFILGNPGAGKTTVLLNMILDHCEERMDSKDSPIPILLNLNEIRGNDYNIEAHVLNAIKDRAMFVDAHQESILEGLRSRNVTYYIDGINEAHIEKPETFMTNLKDFASNHGNCRFYLTGRKYEFASYRKIFSSLKGSGIFEVQEISEKQRHDFLEQLGMTPESIDEFERKIDGSDITDLLGTPLNFYLIAKGFILNESEISAHNRGELLEQFISSTLSDSKNCENWKDPKKFSIRAYSLLQHIARFMFDRKNPFGVKESDIPTDAFDAEEVESILQSMHKLKIIDRKESFGDYEIRFFVDTYYEYFLARQLIKELLENGFDLNKTGIDCNDKNNFETLKLIIEIISCQKDSHIKWGRDFVTSIIENGHTGGPEKLNRHLELLATIVSGLRSHNQRNNPDARKTVENLILNYLVYYRCTHPADAPDDNPEYLETLFRCAISLSGKEILQEILSLYWLAKSGIINTDEAGIKDFVEIKDSYRLRNVMMRNGRNICDFYDALHTIWSSLVFIWPSSAQKLKNFITSTFMYIDIRAQKKLYAHITDMAKNSNDREYLLSDANMLLLFINDMEYVRRFNADEFNYQIYWPPVKALMRLHGDSRLADFIFSDSFIKKLGYTKHMLLYMIRFHLFRGLIPDALGRFIFGEAPKILDFITEDEHKMLLDIIPAHRIPKDIVDRYYNPEVHRFVINRMRNNQDESFGSLLYSHFHSDKDSITVSIKNIRTVFTDAYAIFSIDGKPYEHRILEDRWQLARETRFIISSLDKSIIPAHGTILTAQGKEYEYLAYSSGSTITIAVHDDVMASDMACSSESGETLTLNGIKCSFNMKEDKVNRYRTLKIEKRPDVTLTEAYGELRFAEKKRNTLLPMRIDKQTRREDERNNRDNFRILSTGKSNPASLLYFLIGIHDNSAWITCDPLNEGHQHVKKKIIIGDSTGRGTMYQGKIQAAGNYDMKLVELTFRCKLKPNITKTGKISVIFGDHTESFDYIYSFISHKTVILRLNDPKLTEATYLEELISSVRKQEVGFRISSFELLLESAEILPTEKMFCLKVQVNNNLHAMIPASGLMKYEDDSSFEIKREYRALTPVINGISSWEIQPDMNKASFLIPDDSVKDYCSQYICIDSSPLHLKVNGEPEKLQWTAQMEMSLDINWPMHKGSLHFDNIEGHEFSFIHLHDDTIRIWPVKNSIKFDVFSSLIETAETVEIRSGGKVLKSSIQSHSGLIGDNNEAYILHTDFPSTDEGDIKAWSAPEKAKVMLAYKTAINNKKTKVKIIEFKQNTATYTSIKNEIKIVKPSTPLKDLWVEVDKGKKFTIASVTEVEEDSNYIRLKLLDQDTLAPNLKSKGQIRFFSRDKNQFKATKIGYQNIFSLIDWNSPNRYHADICNILEDELIESGARINETVRRFFEYKSKSYSLISNPILFSKIKSSLNDNKINRMVFDVCRVASSANDTQLSAASYMQKGLVTTSDTDPMTADHIYRQGDYILYEKNHKIHYLESPIRHSALGFFTGTVIKRLRDGNCFLRAHEIREDFYCAAELELGDQVQFFASYNTLDKTSKNKNLAEDVNIGNIEKSALIEGTVKQKEIITTESTAELMKITIASKNRLQEFSIIKDSHAWETISTWKVGDKCKCFFCGKEMFLKY